MARAERGHFAPTSTASVDVFTREQLRKLNAALGVVEGDLTDLTSDLSDVTDDVAELKSSVIFKAFTPAGNTDALVGAPAADWVNMGNITVPTWATSAIIQVNICGIFSLVGVSSGFIRTSIGATNGTDFGVYNTTAAGQRTVVAYASEIATPPTGAQALKIRTDNIATNTLRADTACSFSAIVTFTG